MFCNDSVEKGKETRVKSNKNKINYGALELQFISLFNNIKTMDDNGQKLKYFKPLKTKSIATKRI